jgi:hypothetical protein
MGVLGTESVEELREADWVVESLDGIGVKVDAAGLELGFAAL